MKNICLILSLFVCAIASAQSPLYRTVEDLPYRSGGEPYALERCVLDVHYPEDADGCPVVVWFHGGGLTGGKKSIPERLKQSGLVVIAANYRLLPEATIAQCIDDAAAAVAWAFREAGNYGGDGGKIFVAGHSAGGYLASMTGLDPKWLEAYDIEAKDIAAIVPFSGQAITHYAWREINGIAPTRPTIDEWAPLYWVRPDASPLVIVSGDRELELYGRYEENAYLWRMMKLAGHEETYLYELDGYDHGAMVEPGFHILKNHIRTISKNR